MSKDQVCCMTTSYGKVKGKAAQYPYYQPARYEKKILKNGKTVWCYVGHEGIARRSQRLAEQDAKELAKTAGCKYIGGIRHLSLAK